MNVRLFALPLFLAPLFAQTQTPNNPEVDALYEEDQRDRATDIEKMDWDKVVVRDAAHRTRVRELLDQGALTTGEDFEKAAYIFQHGMVADDQLLGHVLALAAIAKGRSNATDIAAATLDRYLQNIGKQQVLGTQLKKTDSQPWTLEPYNRELIPDALRKQLGVHTLDQQQKRLEAQNRRQ